MEMINEDEFSKDEIEEFKKEEYSKEEFQEMLDKMSNPISYQKELAVKVKLYLDKRMISEMEEEHVLGALTLKWVDQFNKICDSIQKGLYGTKNINLNFHKISHGDIASKISEAEKVIIVSDNENRRSNKKTDPKDGR